MSTTRTVAVWLLLAVLMTVNGIARELVFVPQLGAASAGTVSAILGIAIILGITGLFFYPLVGAPTSQLLRTSVILVVLTVLFELVMGRWVDGKTWGELAANYAVWQGALWPFVLLSVALAPFFWGRWIEPRRSETAPRAGVRQRRIA